MMRAKFESEKFKFQSLIHFPLFPLAESALWLKTREKMDYYKDWPQKDNNHIHRMQEVSVTIQLVSQDKNRRYMV